MPCSRRAATIEPRARPARPRAVARADGGPERRTPGVAERLDRADAHNDLLSGLLGGVNLPVELSGIEATGPVLDAIPVGAQPDQLERVVQQRRQGGHGIKPEGLGLQRPEADPDLGPAARLDRDLLPAVGERACGPRDADLRGDLRESPGRSGRAGRSARPGAALVPCRWPRPRLVRYHPCRPAFMSARSARVSARLASTAATAAAAPGLPSRDDAVRIAPRAAGFRRSSPSSRSSCRRRGACRPARPP